MDNNQPNNPIPPVNPPPVIPEAEMKLPEEQFSEPATVTVDPGKKFGLGTVLLLLLVVVLLGAITAVVLWGEELINLVMPVETTSIDDMPTPTPEETEEAELNNLESDLNDVDFTEMENELNAIEAEIETEASSTATTTVTS